MLCCVALQNDIFAAVKRVSNAVGSDCAGNMERDLPVRNFVERLELLAEVVNAVLVRVGLAIVVGEGRHIPDVHSLDLLIVEVAFVEENENRRIDEMLAVADLVEQGKRLNLRYRCQSFVSCEAAEESK